MGFLGWEERERETVCVNVCMAVTNKPSVL